MEDAVIHPCQGSACLSETAHHPQRQLHEQSNLLFGPLDEQQRRLVAAIESKSPSWALATDRPH